MYSLPGLCATVISFLSFRQFNRSLDGNNFIPVPAKYAKETRHKWRNVVGSLVHATVVSVLGAYCIWVTPEYFTERITTTTTLGEVIVGIFAGYFIFDSIDLIRYQGFLATWPVVLHHIVLITVGLGYFLYLHRLVGYGMLACLIEVNSVFLHGRMLLLMYGYPKASLVFRINNIFNVLTYITFRMGCLIVLVPFVMEDCERMSALWCYWFRFTAVTLLVVNVILFYRLIKSDILTRHHKTSGAIDDCDLMVNTNVHVNGDMNGKIK